jgi:hypothetical protein
VRKLGQTIWLNIVPVALFVAMLLITFYTRGV